jgi:hypothetical protein
MMGIRVYQVFVVCLDHNAMAQEHMTKVLEGFGDGEQFFFSDWITLLNLGKFLAKEA